MVFKVNMHLDKKNLYTVIPIRANYILPDRKK